MKIGFLSVFNFGTSIGGVENHIFFVSRELVKLGHSVTIFQPIDSEDFSVGERVFGNVKVVYIPVNSPRLIKYLSRFNGHKFFGFLTGFLNKARFVFSYKKIANIVLNANVDFVHQHDFISSIFTTKFISKNGVKCALTNHTGEYLFIKSSYIGRLFIKSLLSHFCFIIGPSKELTPDLYHPNSLTIHNGVDLIVFNEMALEDKHKIRIEKGFSDDDILVFCPRRWAPTKGVKYLVESIASGLYSSRYKFLFAGSDYDGYPEYADSINDIISKKELSNIYKLGNLGVDDMTVFYNLSDIVIIPSLMEAVSLSAVEAMATGTPVVSTNVGGMPELIKHLDNGLLINPKSPEEIYNAIVMLENNDLYASIKKRSLETAKDFSWDSIALKVSDLYSHYCSVGSSSSSKR